MAVRRAKAGGETVGGKFFKGGQFIAAEYIERELGTFREKIEKAAGKGAIESIRHAALSIRKTARESIKKSNEPSAPGKPVHTRGKKGNVKNSIFAAIAKDEALIGPRHSFVGPSMELHEFGKSRGDVKFKKRPTMAPALDQNLTRFAGAFRGSIGE
jgi:hypothetical protein